MIITCIGPKALRFSQPRATPWGAGRRVTFLSAQRANRSQKANYWPVGPVWYSRFYAPQGDALGWANGCPFGATLEAAHLLHNLQFVAANLLLLIFFSALSTSTATAADARKVVIPFDFVSKFDGGRYGRMVGEMIWTKLSREAGFIVPESMDEVRDYCAAHKLAPSPEMELAAMQKIIREDFAAQIGIWGSIERAKGADADVYDLTIKCVDFSDERQAKVIYDATVRTKTVSEIPHVYVKRMIDALAGRGKGDSSPAGLDKIAEENWKKQPNLIAGDFEHGTNGVPKGWDKVAGQQREPLGGLVRWTAEKGNPSNKVIRFTLDQQVAENEGVMYYSDYFPVEEGAKYRFQCRWRSDGPAVKVFVKCYDYPPDEGRRREVYRSQQNLKGASGRWNTHTEDFTPRHPQFTPRWGRVMLYAYLKPGSVEFDDVIVKRIAPASPGERLKVRRPSSQGKTTTKEIEADERRGKNQNRDHK